MASIDYGEQECIVDKIRVTNIDFPNGTGMVTINFKTTNDQKVVALSATLQEIVEAGVIDLVKAGEFSEAKFNTWKNPTQE
jgi:hypothetical protein